MHIIDVILLVVKGERGAKLHGRTLLQKKLYFLSVLMGVDLGFTPHYYGPYSSFVAGHLDGLVNYGILKEDIMPFSSSSPERSPLGEIRKHTYIYSVIPEASEEVWRATQKKPEFEKWNQQLKVINDQNIGHDSNKLSIAAKVHYIVSSEGKSTLKQIQKIAKDYDWEVGPKDIENVYSFLRDLKLITTNRS